MKDEEFAPALILFNYSLPARRQNIALHSQPACPVQPVKIALPEDVQGVGIFIVGEVCDEQRQEVGHLAFRDAHFPVCIVVIVPFQLDMIVLHVFD